MTVVVEAQPPITKRRKPHRMYSEWCMGHDYLVTPAFQGQRRARPYKHQHTTPTGAPNAIELSGLRVNVGGERRATC